MEFKDIIALMLAICVVIHIIADHIPVQEFSVEYPHDRIAQSQIRVYDSQIVIDIFNATWAEYTDTGSMRPVLGKGHNGLEMYVYNDTKLYIGDIIAYKSNYVKDTLVSHRIKSIGYDKDGEYFIVKGDNNKYIDPEIVRRNQIVAVIIGVIY